MSQLETKMKEYLRRTQTMLGFSPEGSIRLEEQQIPSKSEVFWDYDIEKSKEEAEEACECRRHSFVKLSFLQILLVLVLVLGTPFITLGLIYWATATGHHADHLYSLHDQREKFGVTFHKDYHLQDHLNYLGVKGNTTHYFAEWWLDITTRYWGSGSEALVEKVKRDPGVRSFEWDQVVELSSGEPPTPEDDDEDRQYYHQLHLEGLHEQREPFGVAFQEGYNLTDHLKYLGVQGNTTELFAEWESGFLAGYTGSGTEEMEKKIKSDPGVKTSERFVMGHDLGQFDLVDPIWFEKILHRRRPAFGVVFKEGYDLSDHLNYLGVKGNRSDFFAEWMSGSLDMHIGSGSEEMVDRVKRDPGVEIFSWGFHAEIVGFDIDVSEN